jgi:isopenicillin N synthase-like dioxygenase
VNNNTPHIPLINLRRWRHGDTATRTAIARELDRALSESGFLLLAEHDVPAALSIDLRRTAKEFFALPQTTKAKYATTVGGRGWLASGKEANSFADQDADISRPDMKESYTIGRDHLTGTPDLDATWFRPNVWPDEVPELEYQAARYMAAMYELYDELLRMCAIALHLNEEWFIERTSNGTRTLNINRYPSLEETGPAKANQFRVAPHTDWSIFTLLDRQIGYGGFQVESDGQWFDAPFVEGSLVINIGDLMARWTGERWRSTRHRVLPPQSEAPQEELISLIQFCDANVDAVVEAMPKPIGTGIVTEPVKAGDYLLQRAMAATVN